VAVGTTWSGRRRRALAEEWRRTPQVRVGMMVMDKKSPTDTSSGPLCRILLPSKKPKNQHLFLLLLAFFMFRRVSNLRLFAPAKKKLEII
jgi:hypothetical protein